MRLLPSIVERRIPMQPEPQGTGRWEAERSSACIHCDQLDGMLYRHHGATLNREGPLVNVRRPPE